MSEIKPFYVPWYNIEEWVEVKHLLSSCDRGQLKRAYEILLIWKLRRNNLPAHVDCTFGICQVLVQDYLSATLSHGCVADDLLRTEYDLQLAYATAITRFVNHVSSGSTLKGGTLYLAAKKQNIPDWVINLRHDVAHSVALPSLELLSAAAELALQWLLENYWLTQQPNMSVLMGDSIEARSKIIESSDLHAVMKNGIAAWSSVRAFKKQRHMDSDAWASVVTFGRKLKTLGMVQGLPVADDLRYVVKIGKLMRPERPLPAKRKRVECPAPKMVSRTIIATLEAILFQGPEMIRSFVSSLLEKDFLEAGLRNGKKWEGIIKLLQRTDGLGLLIQSLLTKLELDDENTNIVGWLNILKKSLGILLRQWTQYEKLKNKDPSIADSDLELEVSKRYPFESGSIKLEFGRPPMLQLSLLHGLILKATSPKIEIIKSYLNLVQPPLPLQTRQLMEELLEMYTKEENAIHCETEKIFSVSDLSDCINSKEVIGEDMDTRQCEISIQSQWKVDTSDPEKWRRCPLGLLPRQTVPNLDLSHVKWCVIPPRNLVRRTLKIHH